MKKLHLEREAAQAFAIYLNYCFNVNLQSESKTFLRLVKFHLKEIMKKLHKQSLKFLYESSKVVRISLTEGERLALSFVFKQVQIANYLVGIEATLIEGL